MENIIKDLNWQIVELQSETKFQGLGQFKSATLPIGTKVIIDQNKQILAIPGVVGGNSSKVTLKTSKILIEIANFDPEEVGRNSFRLNYRSEASKIFAGNINRTRSTLALKRLGQLLGTNSLNKIFSFPPKSETEIYELKIDFDYLASRLDSRDVVYWIPILEQKLPWLGEYNTTNKTLTPNIYYGWIQTQDDLLEELIRLIGFENLEEHALNCELKTTPAKDYNIQKDLKDFITNFGFEEVISRPFVPQEHLLIPENGVKIINPYSKLEPYFRDNLVTSLLKNFALNQLKGHKDIRLFELNQIYTKALAKELCSRNDLALIYSGKDPYLGTTIINKLAKKLGFELKNIETEIGTFGRATYYEFKNTYFSARLTQINNHFKTMFDLPLENNFWVVQLYLVGDLDLKKYPNYCDISEFPAIHRSYSLEIPRALTWQDFSSRLLQNISADINTTLTPKERINQNSSHDKLNFDAKFVSSTRTLTNGEITQWEENMNN